MALFTFADLAAANPSPELRAALQVDADEPLLARRLRGVGKWDAGRLVVELVVPSRLLDGLNYRAEGLLDQVLDMLAPDFKYGEHFRTDLLKRYRADELAILHRWVENDNPADCPPDPTDPEWLAAIEWDRVLEPQPFALQVFYNPPRLRDVRYLPRRLRLRLRARRDPLPQALRPDAADRS